MPVVSTLSVNDVIARIIMGTLPSEERIATYVRNIHTVGSNISRVGWKVAPASKPDNCCYIKAGRVVIDCRHYHNGQNHVPRVLVGI